MIWLAIATAYVAFLAAIYALCLLAGRADARDHAAHEHCEGGSVGVVGFLHDESSAR